ncbi:MAG: alpha/beta fold hydrolase [Candidatus Bathyarchaeales archaeon]
MTGQVLSLPDGRQLGYLSLGKGHPIIYFHGTASSRLEILLLKELAFKAKLQIIGVDRPGYGLSTFKPIRSLGDFSSDINFLADHLDIKRFGILGWSGGGVFALAYLSLFLERVTKAVIAGTPNLPFDAGAAHNTPFARFVMKLPFLGLLAVRHMRSRVLRATRDPKVFLASREGKQLLRGYSMDDLKFFSNPEWVALLCASMAEAFRQGDYGIKAVLQEHRLFMKPWNIQLAKIPADTLFIWHGAEDKTCRVENAHMLSKIIPAAHLEIFPDKGHCVLFNKLGKLNEIFCHT